MATYPKSTFAYPKSTLPCSSQPQLSESFEALFHGFTLSPELDGAEDVAAFVLGVILCWGGSVHVPSSSDVSGTVKIAPGKEITERVQTSAYWLCAGLWLSVDWRGIQRGFCGGGMPWLWRV